jgi:NDP-sugar pyrophosphorylase family protein
MQAVILAGGMGTRLRPLTDSVPKTMVKVLGKPFLEREIGLLRAGGVEDFVLCVGYKAEKVREHFGDGGGLGVKIAYSYDGPKLLGGVGALKKAEAMLRERFFVTYGDAYLRLDYGAMMDAFVASGRLGMMAVYHNRNKHGNSDLVVEQGYVTRYDKRAAGKGLEWINFGISALQKEALALVPEGLEYGEEEFYGELIRRGELASFPVRRRFYEIGSPSALKEFETFLRSSRSRKRLSRRTSRHPGTD